MGEYSRSGNMNMVSEHVDHSECSTPPESHTDSDKTDNADNAEGRVTVEVTSCDHLKPLPVIEQLKDEDGASSLCTSEEEGSYNELSDEGYADKSEGIEFRQPDDELRDKIIKQVEFYFSDANLLKDPFLLKHVQRNKQGFVSIKLITSFKKVKSLTKDYRVVAYSLKHSDKVELNEECKKVRRKDPMPGYDETIPSRSVVVVNLPMETPSIENVAALFNPCGEIALIRIIRPGKPIPQDVKRHTSKHPEIGSTVCAIVEFESHESSKLACDTMNNTDNWRNGLRVVLLASVKHKKKEHIKNTYLKGAVADNDVKQDGETRRRVSRRKNNRLDDLAHDDDSSCGSSGSEADIFYSPHAISKPMNASPSPNRLNANRPSPSSSPRSSPRNVIRGKHHGKSPLADGSPGTSPRNSPRNSPEMSRRKFDGSSDDSSPSSPWVQRRLKAAQSPLADGSSPTGSPSAGRRNLDGSPRMKDMEGVIRQPRGPDGTKGFHIGREKPINNTFS